MYFRLATVFFIEQEETRERPWSFLRNTQDFCQTFTTCYLPCNISKSKIKRIGHQVRLRDMMKLSYPIISRLFTQESRIYLISLCCFL